MLECKWVLLFWLYSAAEQINIFLDDSNQVLSMLVSDQKKWIS